MSRTTPQSNLMTPHLVEEAITDRAEPLFHTALNRVTLTELLRCVLSK